MDNNTNEILENTNIIENIIIKTAYEKTKEWRKKYPEKYKEQCHRKYLSKKQRKLNKLQESLI